MVIESDQLPLMRQQGVIFPSEECPDRTSAAALNHRLFARQEVFSDAKEILSVLPEAFDEAFLWGNIMFSSVMGMNCY